MNTGRSWRPLAALALGAAALSGALAAHAVYNPPIRMANGIEYMGGGASSEEAALMQSVEPRWPASFEFAVKDGERQVTTADVVVTVRDASGRELLSQVEAGGPFLVARLEPGRYQVEATWGGQTLKQEIELLPWQPKRTVFVWPAGAQGRPRS